MSQIEVTERAAAPVLPAAAERAEEALAEEQLAYARLLDAGMRLGLLLPVTSAVYLLGLAAPYIPVADRPRLTASAPPAAPGSP
ncbi:MAG TPA: hypothetical protein VIV59_00200 [Anaeromyxobacteraceae bacterium]